MPFLGERGNQVTTASPGRSFFIVQVKWHIQFGSAFGTFRTARKEDRANLQNDCNLTASQGTPRVGNHKPSKAVTSVWRGAFSSCTIDRSQRCSWPLKNDNILPAQLIFAFLPEDLSPCLSPALRPSALCQPKSHSTFKGQFLWYTLRKPAMMSPLLLNCHLSSAYFIHGLPGAKAYWTQSPGTFLPFLTNI